MSDEIEGFDVKELFEEWEQFLRWCYENNDKTVEIHRDKLKWTMDYITNLQQKVEQLENIRKEAVEYVETIQKSENNINPYILHAPTLLNILNKGSEEK